MLFGLSLLQLTLAIIALLAAIAPLFIWRGINRTNRLLALHLARLNVDHAAVRDAWHSGGSQMPTLSEYKRPTE